MKAAKLRQGLPSLVAGLGLLMLFVAHYPENTGVRMGFLIVGILLGSRGVAILRSGVTVLFEDGTRRKYPEATMAQAQPHGTGVILRSDDGQQVAAFDGPIASMIVNGRRIKWPPET